MRLQSRVVKSLVRPRCRCSKAQWGHGVGGIRPRLPASRLCCQASGIRAGAKNVGCTGVAEVVNIQKHKHVQRA